MNASTVFHWKTMGITVRTEVTEFEPAKALAWSATSPISRAYHRWDFGPTRGVGCLVTTEETEAGLGPRLLASRLKRDLSAAHQVWLEELVKRAQG